MVQIRTFLRGRRLRDDFREKRYYTTLGTLTLIFGVMEAILGFWKEIAARVHKPGEPRYYDSPHAAHRGWYS